MKSRTEILREAEKCINGDRELSHGSPEDNFQTIADLWSLYLGKLIEPEDVAVMMILLKVARIKSGGGSGDHWGDIAGYAACGGEIYYRDIEIGKDQNDTDDPDYGVGMYA